MLWLEGGISHLDTWDVKGNSGFKPISTNAPGVQISEIFPNVAKHMDKLSIIRSMKTEERNHPQGTIETLTGHRPNPALKFPSFGSIVSKELGLRKNMPPFAVVPMPTEGDFFNYQEAYQAAFIGSEYDGMILPDPSKPDFHLPDLSLPKSISAEAIDDRSHDAENRRSGLPRERRAWPSLPRWMRSRSRRFEDAARSSRQGSL